MEVKQLLKEKGVKPTVHRVEILEYLLRTYSHPTADEIFDYFKKEQIIPVLSRATVYNTLKVLADAGIIAAIVTPDAVRYDFIREHHHHFYCTKCRKVYDVYINTELPQVVSVDGHEVHHVQLSLIGICSNCLKETSK